MYRQVVLLVCLLTWSGSAWGSECVPADYDADADVDFADFGILQRCFTGAGGTSTSGCDVVDSDADGDVDLDDYDAFNDGFTGPGDRLDYGSSPFPDAEAEQLALETGLSLLADADMYDRIKRDLETIRVVQPNVANTHYVGLWGPQSMLVRVTNGVTTCEFDELNAFYAATDVDFLFQSGGSTWYVVRYPGRMRIPLLAQEYVTLSEVTFAEPDALVGTDDRIEVSIGVGGSWTYDIDDGFLDCFDGCDCHINWSFEVSEDGDVQELSMVCSGFAWCEFPAFCDVTD
jgi:hypothetical protein